MTSKTVTPQPLVLIVDDDESIREALSDLFRSVGIENRCYASPAELLKTPIPDRPGCLVLDIRMAGTSGLDLQAQLARLDNMIPIIFMTGHGDIPMSVRAMKAGAVDFLTKPFRDQDMLDAVAAAIEKDQARRRDMAAFNEVAALAETLTAREREILSGVVKGLMNKQIAANLGITEMTVKLHRGKVMRKMQARSVPDLVRKAEILGLT